MYIDPVLSTVFITGEIIRGNKIIWSQICPVLHNQSKFGIHMHQMTSRANAHGHPNFDTMFLPHFMKEFVLIFVSSKLD